jgi:hypothetical protein
MIPQTYPLYANILGEDFLVVAWTENVDPVLAPITTSGPIRIYHGSGLKYRTVR